MSAPEDRTPADGDIADELTTTASYADDESPKRAANDTGSEDSSDD